jgi:hypothetical protein
VRALPVYWGVGTRKERKRTKNKEDEDGDQFKLYGEQLGKKK